MRVNLAVNVHHVVVSMSLAIFCNLAALGAKGRLACARVTQTTPSNNVDHSVLSMLLAVYRRLAPLEI